jgi:hypothetical protein
VKSPAEIAADLGDLLPGTDGIGRVSRSWSWSTLTAIHPVYGDAVP